MINKEELKKMWEKLGDVSVNDDGEISEVFLEFTKGTDREEIWMWFEEQGFNLAKAFGFE